MKYNQTIQNLFIDLSKSVLSAIKQMDEFKVKLLIVMKNKEYFSLLSIGDIQRAIIYNSSGILINMNCSK